MESTRNIEPLRTPETAGAGHGRPSGPRVFLRWLPLASLALALLLFYAAGLHDYISLEALRRYRGGLDAFVEAHAVLAAATYLLFYAATVAVSFPGASVLTIVGGLLFGVGPGTGLAGIGATLGATLVFLIARTSFGDFLAGRAGVRGEGLRQGFQDDGFSYLLFLRLVPLFPFWLVNLAAALFHMRLIPYVAATAIGVLPATFVFAYFGAGLGTTLEGSPASPQLFVALALLGLLALLPVVVRRWRRGRGQQGTPGGPQA